MRDIKFKAQRVSDGEWVEGSLIQDYIHHQPNSTITQGGCIYNEVAPESVCQFTGLVDRNGVDVYEGDKMTVNENVNGTIKPYDVFIKYSGSGFVIYNPDCCSICRDGYGCICSLDEAMCLGEIEIIGNIHNK